jgi:hypothetical protein
MDASVYFKSERHRFSAARALDFFVEDREMSITVPRMETRYSDQEMHDWFKGLQASELIKVVKKRVAMRAIGSVTRSFIYDDGDDYV